MEGSRLLLSVFALVCLVQGGMALRKWNDLRIKFDALPLLGYHQVPTKSSDSKIKDFVKVEPEASFRFPIDFYCYPDDPRMCLMFDKKGNVAGVQTSFIGRDMSNVRDADFNYTGISNFEKTNFFNNPAYSLRVYFTNPETLTEAGRHNNEETAEGLWVYLEGKLVLIPREQPKEDRFGDFYKQGCLPAMGLHYFYNIHSKSTCKEMFPLFPLYEAGSLVGYGLATVGKGSTGTKDWYEHPPLLALKLITPYRPQCMDDLSNKYGYTSMHVYLVNRPWAISCPIFGFDVPTIPFLG